MSRREQYRLPRIDPPTLEGLKVTVLAPSPPSAEDLIERLHQEMRAKSPRRERKPGEPIQPGDEVECDVITVVDGTVIPGGVMRDARLEMRDFVHLPGFIDQMLGMEAFTARTFELDLPEDYPSPEVAGERAVFYVEARRVFEVDQAPLDDIQALSTCGLGKSLEEAMETVASLIDKEQGETLLVDATGAVLEALAQRVEAHIPEAAVDEELHRIWLRTEGAVFAARDFSSETVSRAEHDFLQNPDLRAQVRARIKVGLALGALVESERLSPSEEVMTQLLESAAEGAGVSLEEARSSLKEEPLGVQTAAHAALYQTAVEFVMARVRVEVVEPEDGEDQ